MIPINDEDTLRENQFFLRTSISSLLCHTMDNEKHKDRAALFFRDALTPIFPAPTQNVRSSTYLSLLNERSCIHSARGSQIHCSFQRVKLHYTSRLHFPNYLLSILIYISVFASSSLEHIPALIPGL